MKKPPPIEVSNDKPSGMSLRDVFREFHKPCDVELEQLYSMCRSTASNTTSPPRLVFHTTPPKGGVCPSIDLFYGAEKKKWEPFLFMPDTLPKMDSVLHVDRLKKRKDDENTPYVVIDRLGAWDSSPVALMTSMMSAEAPQEAQSEIPKRLSKPSPSNLLKGLLSRI